ncbi:MAG: hypothetical protein QXW79_00335 [Thermoplasmata archaeon]
MILLVPERYKFIGSFSRKIVYITDIDVVNDVYPEINRKNIYNHVMRLVEKIEKLVKGGKSKIIFFYIKCGKDERFNVDPNFWEKIDKIYQLVGEENRKEIDAILEKYKDNPDKIKFFVEEMVKEYYELKWMIDDIKQNKLVLPGGKEISFRKTVESNDFLLLRYYIKISSYPVGFDVVVKYEKTHHFRDLERVKLYLIKRANYKKEYYYMLFRLLYYFYHHERKKWNNMIIFVEKKFGLYKQLIVRINVYHRLYRLMRDFDIETARDIVVSIVKDLKYLPEFRSTTLDKIRNVSINNPPEVKIEKWNILLNALYNELNAKLNSGSRKYFFKFLRMIPKNIRKYYYLNDS